MQASTGKGLNQGEYSRRVESVRVAEKVIRSQLVSQLIHVQLVSLDFGPQGVINKIYNLLHHVVG